jgi:hypothetical protein
MPRVRDRLFAVSPYRDIDASPHPTDTRGWGSDRPFFDQMLDLLRPATIVEVGTWKGACHTYRRNRQASWPFGRAMGW